MNKIVSNQVMKKTISNLIAKCKTVKYAKERVTPPTYGARLIDMPDDKLIQEVRLAYQDSVVNTDKDTSYMRLIVSLQHAVARALQDPLVLWLKETDLLVEQINPLVTFGTDVEFLLKDKNDEYVLFNSSMVSEWFHLSSARIGSDMGLLEFRVEPSADIGTFVKNITELHESFAKRYTDGKDSDGKPFANPLHLVEQEAINIPLNKLILESKERDPSLKYGSGKLNSFSRASGQVLLEGRTMYAYSDRPLDNDYTFTSCGGHLHFGGIVKSFTQSQMTHLVKLFDTHLAPIFLPIENKEEAILRRRYYGLAGEFRIKEHGMEYRTPSNALFYPKNREVLKKVLKKAAWVIQNVMDLTPDKDAANRINMHDENRGDSS